MVISICKHVKHNIWLIVTTRFHEKIAISISHLQKWQLFIIKKLNMYWTNVHTQHVILDQYMFIGHIINLYILHLNYQIMFPILYCLDFYVFCPSHICFNIQSPQNNLLKTYLTFFIVACTSKISFKLLK